MKICLINNLYKPFNRGGAERITEILSEGLRESGHEVFLVSTKPYFQNKKNIENPFTTYRLSSLYFNLKTIPVYIRLFWHFFDVFDVVTFFKVRRIMKKEKPDLIVSGNLKGLSFLLPILFRNLKIKHIHILHDIQLLHPSGLMYFGKEKILDSVFAKIYQKINAFLFSPIEAVVSPSDWLLEKHLDLKFFPKTKKLVIRNPITSEKSKKIKIGDGLFRFLYIGHLSKAKGVEVLLEAFKELLVSFPEERSKLILAGKGEIAEGYDKTIGEKNLEVMGFVNPEEVKRLMAQADLLIVPSLCYENSPTVIYEAIQNKLPFAVSDLGGSRELAKEFNGILFQAGNSLSLYQCMKNAIKKPSWDEDSLSRKKRQLASYGVESYIEKLLGLID